MQRIEVPVRVVQRAVVPRDLGEDATADDISMFCWNVNNRVGRIPRSQSIGALTSLPGL